MEPPVPDDEWLPPPPSPQPSPPDSISPEFGPEDWAGNGLLADGVLTPPFWELPLPLSHSLYGREWGPAAERHDSSNQHRQSRSGRKRGRPVLDEGVKLALAGCIDPAEGQPHAEQAGCGVCMGPAFNMPVHAPCGHLFHLDCLRRAMDRNIEKDEPRQCPVCRAEVGPGAGYTRSWALANILDGTDVECPLQCDHPPKRMRFDRLELHVEADCPLVPVLCTSEGCDAVVPRRDLRSHLLLCPHRETPCKDCGKMLRRCLKRVHAETCPARMVLCEFCRRDVPQCDTEHHLLRHCTAMVRPERLAEIMAAQRRRYADDMQLLTRFYEARLTKMDDWMEARARYSRTRVSPAPSHETSPHVSPFSPYPQPSYPSYGPYGGGYGGGYAPPHGGHGYGYSSYGYPHPGVPYTTQTHPVSSEDTQHVRVWPGQAPFPGWEAVCRGYILVPGLIVNGSPVWAADSARIYKNRMQQWMVAKNPQDVPKNRGLLRNTSNGGSAFPSASAGWEIFKPGKWIWSTGSWASVDITVTMHGWNPAAGTV
eukprot:TRINITY_DN269_c0_g1_i2.p1 TRINITY_DN269_c0_g1~~TRINITY_DN269_c0_g1_i2.p1  ORF type:complete len:567 (+),score=113.93 TRINITY_DN269_c0_g1_i2:89-1702(+)